MKTILTLIVGAIGGFVAAHFINQTEQGRAFFESVNDAVREISDAVAEGYRES